MHSRNNYGATNSEVTYMHGYSESEMDEEDQFGFGHARNYHGNPSIYGDFSGTCDIITDNIMKISNNATTVERAMRQIGTNRDSVQVRDKIHDTEKNTNDIITDTLSVIQKLSSLCISSNKSQKLMCERLKGEFQNAVRRYNDLQKKAAEKVKQTASSNKTLPSNDLITWNDTNIVSEENLSMPSQMQKMVIDADLQLLEEREERLQQFERDILDINEIFEQLGENVHAQADQINSIEDNVECAYSHVEAGQEQLVQAAKSQV